MIKGGTRHASPAPVTNWNFLLIIFFSFRRMLASAAISLLLAVCRRKGRKNDNNHLVSTDQANGFVLIVFFCVCESLCNNSPPIKSRS